MSAKEPREQRPNYLRLFGAFVRPYGKQLLVVYLLYFLNSVLNLFPAFVLRFYIDLFLLEQDASFLGLALKSTAGHTLREKVILSLWFLAGMVALIVLANAIGVVMWRLGTRVVEKILFDIRIQILNHINKLSLGYFSSERVGNIMTKAVGDVGNVSMLLKNSFNLTYQVIQFCLAPILMISLSPLLFLVILIPIPLIVTAFYAIRLKLKPMYKALREQESAINSQVQEVISGIKEIKAFNMEERSERSYSDTNMKFYDLQNRVMRVFSFNHQLQYGSRDLGLVLLVVLGGLMILFKFGGITVGMLTSMIALSGFIYGPIGNFLFFYDTLQRGLVSLERILDFLGIEPDILDRKDAASLRRSAIRGRVAFNNVTFGYTPGRPVLENITFAAEPGEKIAVVGPSGSGKSTLLSLLSRFYEPDSGTVTIDGRDVCSLTQTSLRQSIGIVFQETFLFYGSIRDNLLFANPDADDEQMVEACRAADIHETIMQLPERYDTMVGERGVRLSGGQRQRLSIARVFLKDPAVVVLDEATSSVDTITEAEIQSSIEQMLKGRTAFIIAHRLSTIKRCDRIIVLDDKKLIEIGTHAELLKKQGVYYTLHEKSRNI
jgi:ATP-binding cassette subfamily B protein